MNFVRVSVLVGSLLVAIGCRAQEDSVRNVQVGETSLVVPADSLLNDTYFGSQGANARFDQVSSINLDLPLFDNDKPSVVTIFEYREDQQLYHPEAMDAYLGVGRYKQRNIHFNQKENVWQVFPEKGVQREWMLFSQSPNNANSTFKEAWIAYCYNASFVEDVDRPVCMARAQASTLLGKFRFKFENLKKLPKAKENFAQLVQSYIQK